MFWVLRKILFLLVLGGLIVVILNLEYQGRPVKDHVKEIVKTPLIQEINRQVKGMVLSYLKKDVKEEDLRGVRRALEDISEEERKDLEKVIEKESRR